VAETGNPATLQGELDDGKYLDVATHAGPVFAADDFKMEIMLEADAMHDQLGLISMIAPSPDWRAAARIVSSTRVEMMGLLGSPASPPWTFATTRRASGWTSSP